MISNSSKYAIKALLYICQASDGDKDKLFRVEDISKKAGVPGPYLSKVLKTLAQKKLIISRRGKSGGVRINPKLTKITFYDVCEALGDPIIKKYCFLSMSSCSSTTPCLLHSRWYHVREGIHKFLQGCSVN